MISRITAKKPVISITQKTRQRFCVRSHPEFSMKLFAQLKVSKGGSEVKNSLRYFPPFGQKTQTDIGLKTLRHYLLTNQILRNLHSIGSSPFPQVISHYPAVQSVYLRQISTNTPHKYIVLSFRI
ncbi:hypothetical protein Oweho_2432 [Owenweeksia hongkongensis DSM 17368]|uniref:Uncharacterized protein n=1 Tax=Owenweeksia hongkongensis (strain DSM 17368 / CIP 108786 / JCM 12287 / NRRL B-23963 / UST20020801) TaxID=926562 RepID=G8R737_OWEHD|nr:hypothetical protein Oweho_2432 [Owenweeksia hongkongensis DSM 17368]